MIPLLAFVAALWIFASGAQSRLPVDPSKACKDPETLEPILRARVLRFIELAKGRVYLLEAVRTPMRQAWLYAQGRSRDGDIVTWTLKSRHLPDVNGLAHSADLWITGRGFTEAESHAVSMELASLDELARQCGLHRPLKGTDDDHYEAL